jgi:anthranilate synthase/aminodeoxychorismate synthase-like glutamine amidotransferase
MILFLDNYDSFTYNLVQYLGEMNPDLRVVRNDKITVEEALALKPSHIVVSPGPCTPHEAGISMDLIKAVPTNIPLLGVCLGHQAIGAAFGGTVLRAPEPLHGKTSVVEDNQRDLFEGMPSTFTATRYHSLIVEKKSLPAELEITAKTHGKTPDDEDIIMGLRHKTRPIFGLQFHPESILTEHGKTMLRNFLNIKGT